MANVFYQKGKKYNCTKNGIPYFRKTAVIGGKQRSFYGDGEKDALKKIEEAKELERQGFDFEKRNALVDDVFTYWLYDIKRIDKNVKPKTFITYEGLYRKHFSGYPIAELRIATLTSAAMQRHINNMYETEGKNGKTIQSAVRLMNQFCKWAIAEGYLVKNPCSNLILPGEHAKKREVETFSKEERSALLSYMDETGYGYDTLIKLAFATGMRQGELLALQWGDIVNGVLHVRRTLSYYKRVEEGSHSLEFGTPKSISGDRCIPLLPSTQEMLRKHRLEQKKYMLANGLPQTEFVFTSSKGTPIIPTTLDRSYRSLLARAGVPYKKFHAIRHTFATEAIQRGVPVKDLQMLMGHADIATTYIYVHSTTETKRNAIELIGEMM